MARPAQAQAQLHLHGVVVTDVEGLSDRKTVSGPGTSFPRALPAASCYLLLGEPEAPGEIEGRGRMQQPSAALPVQHDAVVGAVRAGPHRGVLAVGDRPVEVPPSPQRQLPQALFG